MLKNNKSGKYDIVILLCPGTPNIINENEIQFDTLEKNIETSYKEIYLGGSIRMQAAVDIRKKTIKYIVVGGSKHKVDVMKQYLVKENINNNDIIRIESNPDTNGNLFAVKKILKQYGKLKYIEGKKIGIMTNAYHIPRAMRMVTDIFADVENLHFVPLVAEAIITKHHPDYLLYPQEFLARMHKEINGLRDWENGFYKNQYKSESEWKSILHDNDLIEEL